MPINNITQTISTIPEAGRRGIDVQTQFVIKQEDFQDHLAETTIDELNTLKDQLNTRIGEINSTTTTMNGYADTASAGASTATTKAGEAATSASAALTSKNQANTFATNSSNSATKASQWADNNYNVEVEAGKYSAKHWATVAENFGGDTVKLAGNQTVDGVKTFSSNIVGNITGNSGTATNASKLGGNAPSYYQQALGFTPIQQGTGIGQLSNVVKIGWTGNRTKITIDATDMGNIVMDSNIGVANSSLVKTALNASGEAPIYACRAWVNFNGTGTVAIRASGNVSSITDNGVGDYTVNFTVAMPDVNHSVVGQGSVVGSDGRFQSENVTARTISAYRMTTVNTNQSLTDSTNVSIAVFR